MQIDKKKLRKQRCNAEKTKISNVYLRTDPLFSGIIIETMLDLKGHQVMVVGLAGVANTIPKGETSIMSSNLTSDCPRNGPRGDYGTSNPCWEAWREKGSNEG
jgi:hypothetical protein